MSNRKKVTTVKQPLGPVAIAQLHAMTKVPGGPLEGARVDRRLKRAARPNQPKIALIADAVLKSRHASTIELEVEES